METDDRLLMTSESHDEKKLANKPGGDVVCSLRDNRHLESNTKLPF